MENGFSQELIEKAGKAESAEELLALAKENDVELSKEAAKEYFAKMNRTGELSDEELDNVAGGGCQTKVGGENYTVVTSGCPCFTGKYEYYINDSGRIKYEAEPRSDGWCLFTSEGCCGRCVNLGFKNGLGYCKVEH